MPVGNDVVDLRDPENQPGAIHPRFDQRAFTESERLHLRDAHTAHRTRWLMWSAKEAAFKAARKLDSGVRFLPRRFAVELDGDSTAVVTHRADRFRVSFTSAEDWVHAVASAGAAGFRQAYRTPTGLVERVRGCGMPRELSAKVRELARSRIARLLAIPAREIRIVARRGIPIALSREAPLPVDLSLSHHGRFLALALVDARPEAPVLALSDAGQTGEQTPG